MRTDVDPDVPNTSKEAAPELVVPAEQLVDALSCPICLQLLTDPLIAACCHNNFCRQCLKDSLRAKPECPLCRAPLTLQNTLPNRAIRNLLPNQQLEAPAGGFQLLQDGRRHAHRLLSCLLVAMALCACVLVAMPSAPALPCAVARLLPSGRLASAGLWACRAPEPSNEPLSRGGNSLEPTPDWGRIVVASSEHELPPASRQPPALAEGGHLRGEAAMPGFGAADTDVPYADTARPDDDMP